MTDHEEQQPEPVGLDADQLWRFRGASYPRSRPDLSRQRRPVLKPPFSRAVRTVAWNAVRGCGCRAASGRRLKDCPVVVDLHELSPVGRRATAELRFSTHAQGLATPPSSPFSSLAASPGYRDRFLGDWPGLLTPKHARSFLGSLLRSVLRAARKALNSRSVVGSYVMGSASLPIEALILAHWPALSGMVSGGFTSCWRAPKMRFRGWLDGLGMELESSRASYNAHSREFVSCHGVFLGPGYSGQKIRPAYFSGKTRGRRIGHGD